MLAEAWGLPAGKSLHHVLLEVVHDTVQVAGRCERFRYSQVYYCPDRFHFEKSQEMHGLERNLLQKRVGRTYQTSVQETCISEDHHRLAGLPQ